MLKGTDTSEKGSPSLPALDLDLVDDSNLDTTISSIKSQSVSQALAVYWMVFHLLFLLS